MTSEELRSLQILECEANLSRVTERITVNSLRKGMGMNLHEEMQLGDLLKDMAQISLFGARHVSRGDARCACTSDVLFVQNVTGLMQMGN